MIGIEPKNAPVNRVEGVDFAFEETEIADSKALAEVTEPGWAIVRPRGGQFAVDNGILQKSASSKSRYRLALPTAAISASAPARHSHIDLAADVLPLKGTSPRARSPGVSAKAPGLTLTWQRDVEDIDAAGSGVGAYNWFAAP